MFIATILVILVVVVYIVIHSTANDNDYTTWETDEYPSVFSYDYEVAEDKGKEGESEVARVLSTLPSDAYIVLNDVLLPTKRSTNQLDHIVISLYGVFVIETKNYSGKIYGGRYSEKWTQYIGKEEYSFFNPLLQNDRHAEVVANYIHIPKHAIFPIVVFTGDATVKTSAEDSVVYLENLLDTIFQHHHRLFSYEQIHNFAKSLDAAIEENKETMHAHIRFVKETQEYAANEVSLGNCPQCDGHLVLRHGRYGDFWGCSNYPRCKYSRNVNPK